MPLYEYHCPQCNEESERVLSIKDESYQTCNTCGTDLTKLISPCTFRLKGAGWANNGYSVIQHQKGRDAKSCT
jgi:putative FmdB family regulatory protein